MPMTRNHCSLTFTYSPIGSSAPKSSVRAPSPITQTGAASRLPASSKKRPDATRRPAMSAVARLDAVDLRHLALRLRHELLRHVPLARGGRGDAGHVRANHPQVALGQARRRLAHLLERLEIGRLARLDDQVAHAELLDERQDLRCAPAPIDIIETTAATPKIIPSIVSSDRSLWTRSVSTPRSQSRDQLADGRLERGPPTLAIICASASRAPQQDADPRPLALAFRVRQRHVRVGGEAFDHDTALGAARRPSRAWR